MDGKEMGRKGTRKFELWGGIASTAFSKYTWGAFLRELNYGEKKVPNRGKIIMMSGSWAYEGSILVCFGFLFPFSAVIVPWNILSLSVFCLSVHIPCVVGFLKWWTVA